MIRSSYRAQLRSPGVQGSGDWKLGIGHWELEKGLTLLGVLIATALVVLVVAALAALAQRIGGLTRLTQDRHTATFLAREGLELVRSLRDENWLAEPRCTVANLPCTIKWRGDPGSVYPEEQRRAICNDPDNTADGVGQQMIDSLTVQLVGVVNGGLLYLTPDGFFTHTEAGNEATIFSRTIEITTGGGEDCRVVYNYNSATPPVEFLVQSRVEWTERAAGGGQRQVTLSERLYPWLKVR